MSDEWRSPSAWRPPSADPPAPSELRTEEIPAVAPPRGRPAKPRPSAPAGRPSTPSSTATASEQVDRRGARRRGRRRNGRVLIVLAILVLPLVLGVGWFAYELRPGSSGKPVLIDVKKDWGTSEIADTLAAHGVIDSPLAFRMWATISGAGSFAPGHYEFHEGIGIRGAIRVLEKGPPRGPDVELLLPPGLTVAQIADRVGRLRGHTAAGFLQVVTSGSIRSKYEPAGVNSLEGLLFPDTYFIGAHESDESIVRRLVARFDQVADNVGLANAHGLSPYQVVVAASLIQTEAKLAEDAPLISAVIRNRLAKSMPLQIDSTLCYAKPGGCPPAPTDADKTLASPYNTYRIAGLPPTPIASVTEASLSAALAPANVPYLYYVIADANGKHAFATTLQEHERNVAAARRKGLL